MENMRSRGRGRRARGRGRGTANAKRKRSIERREETNACGLEDDPLTQDSIQTPESHSPANVPPLALDMEADISQLEAPTFTTLSRGPPEPMLRLKWGHPVNLIGEKVLNPMIHTCDTCLRPIFIYGRMIPCKHVFCLGCAHRDCKQCPRCKDKVMRVEQTGLGTVFMCTHGGSRYGNKGCRRTYLSQRDLQAHINHRHVSVTSVANTKMDKVLPLSAVPPVAAPTIAFFESPKLKFEEQDVGVGYGTSRGPPDGSVPVSQPPPTQVPGMPRPSGNLITVPIQEPPPDAYFNAFNQPPPSVLPHGPPPAPAPVNYFPPTFDYPPPDTSIPPPNQWPTGNPQFF